MGNKPNKSAAAKSAALSSDEFQKLTPEQQLEYVKGLQANQETLEAKNSELEKSLVAAKPDDLPTIEVDEDEANDIEGGEYQFTCPAFTWDDGSVRNVRELLAEAEGKDKKEAEKAQAIISALVLRKSGILKRKED